MKLTYYGHACFGIEAAGKHLLFDPFITPNALASHIDVDSIPADYILISHAHQDHVADVERIAQRTGAQLVSNFEIITYYANKGLSNGQPLNHGGQWKFDFGTVKYTNAVHSSSFADGTYGGQPGGFILQSEGKTIYYAGDTALMADMELYGKLYTFDLVILPIGDCFTMGPEDAAIAADLLQCTRVLGVHYDTFPLIQIDKEHARSAFQSKGKNLILMDIGASMDI